jgi:hypothetical protein
MLLTGFVNVWMGGISCDDFAGSRQSSSYIEEELGVDDVFAGMAIGKERERAPLLVAWRI